MLKFAGIFSSSMFGGVGLGQVKVMVRESDVANARKLLEGDDNA
jgi:hypothetical protein